MKDIAAVAIGLGTFGLLISLVRAILEAMNGNLWFLGIFAVIMIPGSMVFVSMYRLYKFNKLTEQEHLMDILKRQHHV